MRSLERMAFEDGQTSRPIADDLAQLTAAVAALTETVRVHAEVAMAIHRADAVTIGALIERIDVLERHHLRCSGRAYTELSLPQRSEHEAMLTRQRATTARGEVVGMSLCAFEIIRPWYRSPKPCPHPGRYEELGQAWCGYHAPSLREAKRARIPKGARDQRAIERAI